MNLLQFLDTSPTAWHACANCAHAFEEAGFSACDETKAWKLKSGKSYYAVRNGGSLIAFIMPKKKLEMVVSIAAHTDSPGLKLKPQGESIVDGNTMLHFEIYGAPILPSWIGRDLYLAGRIFYEQKEGIASKIVDFRECPMIMANLAFHLDRQVNDAGLVVKKQEHLAAIISTTAKPFLAAHLKKKVPGKVLYHELFAVPCEESRMIGAEKELVSSARLDNLAHCACALEAFLAQKPAENTLKVLALFAYEEIGSQTQEGADSTFFADVLERISTAADLSKEEYLCLKANSSTISCDVGHASHPNHPDRHDARHLVTLGSGPLIKTNAQCRYITDGDLAALIVKTWTAKHIPFQYFSCRNDIVCGATIGPIHAAKMGIKTIDIGMPLLGMHAAREVIHKKDYDWLVKGLELILSS